jgi:ubiquinone/menaquinone biosynthesis C-methylase UbiE
MDNPWLQIPASDYEAHMGSPEVAQLSFLAQTFKESLKKYDCRAVALLGCATGNGLEYISSKKTRRLTVIDINPDYLEVLRQRHEKSVQGLEIIEADLETCELNKQAYSLIFAGLIFEYLDPRKLLTGISGWLRKKGVMVAVLQLPARNVKKVTNTSFVSLKKLESIMHLVSPQAFRAMARYAGLQELEAEFVIPGPGKPFYIGTYIKM